MNTVRISGQIYKKSRNEELSKAPKILLFPFYIAILPIFSAFSAGTMIFLRLNSAKTAVTNVIINSSYSFCNSSEQSKSIYMKILTSKALYTSIKKLKFNSMAVCVALTALLIISASCGSSSSDGGSAAGSSSVIVNAQPAEIIRLDNIVAAGGDSIPASLHSPMETYMQIIRRSSGNLSEDISAFRLDPAFGMFYQPVYEEFVTTDDLSRSLGRVDAYLSEYLPEVKPQTYFGIVSPRADNRIITAGDTATFIVLNFYLGEDFEAYTSFPEYKRAFFNRNRIAADVAEALIASKYPYDQSNESTLISALLYNGALTKAIVDASGVSLADYLGWSPEQLDFASKNERNIWLKLASDNLIYSTNPADAARLLNPAPNASLISNETPGQIGRYIGYKIVESYLAANPNVAIESLLSEDFYNNPSSLPASNYAP